jgi:serine/threonine protein phosphatase PrpC
MTQAARPFVAARASAIGTRTGNQDRCFFFDDGDAVMLGVADGLGGHPRGDVAAHETIRRFGSRQMPPIAPRTTAVLAIIQHGIAHWVHVGDSRLYLFRAGEVMVQTADHAHTQFIRFSDDAPPRARTSLTRCLGGLPEPPTTTCGTPFPLAAGDSMLLCTDGLWNQVAEARLASLFDAAPERLEGLLESLVDAAAAHPLSDNVTAVALTWLEGNGDDRPYAAAPHDAEPVFDQDLTNCED